MQNIEQLLQKAVGNLEVKMHWSCGTSDKATGFVQNIENWSPNYR